MNYLAYQDESGVSKEEDKFIIGILFIKKEDEYKLRDLIQKVRDNNHFYDELHFNKTSNLRSKVYKELLQNVLSYGKFKFHMIVIDKKYIDYKRFGGKSKIGRSRVYNKFTQLRVLHSIEKIGPGYYYIYTDAKSSIKEDNFTEYLKNYTNFVLMCEGYTQYIIKTVEPINSKKDDLLQLDDLLLGALSVNHNNKCTNENENENENKKELAAFVRNDMLHNKSRYEEWIFKTNKNKIANP